MVEMNAFRASRLRAAIEQIVGAGCMVSECVNLQFGRLADGALKFQMHIFRLPKGMHSQL